MTYKAILEVFPGGLFSTPNGWKIQQIFHPPGTGSAISIELLQIQVASQIPVRLNTIFQKSRRNPSPFRLLSFNVRDTTITLTNISIRIFPRILYDMPLRIV